MQTSPWPRPCNPNCRGLLGVPARAAATAWTWQEGPPNSGCREQNKDRPCLRPWNLWSCHMAWTQGLGRCDELRILRPGDCPGCLAGPRVFQGPHGHRGQRQGARLLPEPPEGTRPAHTLVLDFRAPELGDHKYGKCVVSEPLRVVICNGSSRKATRPRTEATPPLGSPRPLWTGDHTPASYKPHRVSRKSPRLCPWMRLPS